MMKSRLLLVLALGASLALSAFAGASALAAGAGGNAASTVTIDPWPGGVLGEVLSPDSARCADGRQVVVYRQRGEQRDPAGDERVGADRATAAAGDFGWAVELDGSGPYYAQVKARQGCREALSPVLSADDLGATAATPDYPACGPYFSETGGRICRIQDLRYKVFWFPRDPFCTWDDARYANAECSVNPLGGPFPWGYVGWPNKAKMKVEGASGRWLSIGWPEQKRATLTGTAPSWDSPRFTVTDAIAPGEGPSDQSDHFYTPNLPGQGPGEVGGPLKMDYSYHVGFQEQFFTFNGYLYLKR